MPFWQARNRSGQKIGKGSFPEVEKGELSRIRHSCRMDGCREISFLFPTRPSFSTAHRERSCDLSHIRKTLNPGVPVLPLRPASFEAVGQWLVCCAGASPTEDPCTTFASMLRSIGKCAKTLAEIPASRTRWPAAFWLELRLRLF